MEVEKQRTYMCIDLKSFYASVECIERGLDPMTAKLVVADPERSEKTICLAVSPALKAMGVPGRCRVFEIPKNINYIKAPPRMKLYIDYSADIYQVYLKYVAKEDIHVYSIDEVFMDVTDYLKLYGMTAKELGKRIMDDVYRTTGITATCGIGTNMYLAKIALDITAKHVEDHIGILDEKKYIETLWDHRPLRDFWRIGAGTARRLERQGIFTMKQIAHANEDMLYKTFGVDAELLIDHAWGREPVTMADIKNYRAKANCLSSGQVLSRDYNHEEGRLIVREMVDLMCQDLVRKKLVAQSFSLYLGYSKECGAPSERGTAAFAVATNSEAIIAREAEQLYDRIKIREFPIRRLTITCNDVREEEAHQLNFFIDEQEQQQEETIQKTLLSIKEKFGKNSIVKAMNLEEAATTMERNCQIGGHKSGEKG